MQQATPSWKYSTNLGIGANVNLPLGGENGTVNIVPTAGYKYLVFGFRFDTIVTLTVLLSIDTVGVFTQLALAGVVNTWMTPYDLVSPIGDPGYLMVTAPYIRLNLTNGAVATTFSKFYAYLCN